MWVVVKHGVLYGPFFDVKGCNYYIEGRGIQAIATIVKIMSPEITPIEAPKNAPQGDPNPEL